MGGRIVTFYTEFATLPAELASAGMGVGGPSFTGQRVGEATPIGNVTKEYLSARTLVFIAAQLETFVTTFPEVRVWAAPYLVFATLGVDIQYGDAYTDGTHSYYITGQPVTHYGFVLAPAALYPGAFTAVVLLRESGGALLLESGGYLLQEAA